MSTPRRPWRVAKKRRSSLRRATSPRGIAAIVLLAVFVVATLLLGRWQWDRTQGILEAERAAKAQRAPIEQVLPDTATEVPADAMGHRVSLAGRWLPQAQVAVVNREVEGRPGVWILTALQLDDGPVVAVVRGWLPAADSPGSVAPGGRVVVDGIIQPEERFYAGAVTPPGTITALSDLSAALGRPVLPGYVALTSQDPPMSPAPVPIEVQVSTDVPFPLRNFVYALQWWLFGLFAVALFVRWLWRHDSARGEHPRVWGETSPDV